MGSKDLKTLATCTAVSALALASASRAAAQVGVRSPGAKRAAAVVARPGGAWLGGADDCAGPHTVVPAGDNIAFPFDLSNATTGSEGQNEAVCSAFGTSAIASDVWFDWTADDDGLARFRTCNSTAVDTKAAAWPGNPGGCPTDGTALICNDDACVLQTSMQWAVTSGSTWLIQLGTFPGAAAGAGTFDLEILPFGPCGQYDDGASENAFGLNAGGEVAWMHWIGCMSQIERVDTAYGTALFPGSVSNGNAARIAVYADADADLDATTGLTLVQSLATVVANGDTDILNPNPLAAPAMVGGSGWILASADHVPGEYPGPMDQSNGGPQSWFAGSTLGPGMLDLVDLNANDISPRSMSGIGYPTYWLLRAGGDEAPGAGTAFGFCDGSGSAPPCNNPGAPGNGCANGSAAEGCNLTATGLPSVSHDTLVLVGSGGVPGEFGLYFQADDQLPFGGDECVPFGDGMRCIGVNAFRLQTVQSAADGTSATSATISLLGQVDAGDTKYYQLWYRDPQGTPCGSGFNLSNGYTIVWLP